MLPCALLAFAFAVPVFAAPAAPAVANAAVVAACMDDVLPNLAAVRARNAWVARCEPQVPVPPAYPEGSFVAFLNMHAPARADASCTTDVTRAVLCTGEGLLAGQRLLTAEGWLDVVQLADGAPSEVASWDSAAPSATALPMSAVLQVVRRPYHGPVILLETEEGALLDVTAGQPLLLARGSLVRADSLRLGDALLGADGLHRVARVKQVHRNTFVYQVVVGQTDFDHNVLLGEGLFFGGTRLAQQAMQHLPPNR